MTLERWLIGSRYPRNCPTRRPNSASYSDNPSSVLVEEEYSKAPLATNYGLCCASEGLGYGSCHQLRYTLSTHRRRSAVACPYPRLEFAVGGDVHEDEGV